MLAAAAILAAPKALGAQASLNLSDFITPAPLLNSGGGRTKNGKHRLSGTVPSAGAKHRTTDWRGAPGNKQAAKNLKRLDSAAINVHFAARMAWNERNAHVIAKRELDQARAAGPLGGRNAIIWGRR